MDSRAGEGLDRERGLPGSSFLFFIYSPEDHKAGNMFGYSCPTASDASNFIRVALSEPVAPRNRKVGDFFASAKTRRCRARPAIRPAFVCFFQTCVEKSDKSGAGKSPLPCQKGCTLSFPISFLRPGSWEMLCLRQPAAHQKIQPRRANNPKVFYGIKIAEDTFREQSTKDRVEGLKLSTGGMRNEFSQLHQEHRIARKYRHG